MGSNNLQSSNEDIGSPQCSSNFHLSSSDYFSPSNSHSQTKNQLHRASDLLMAFSVCTNANRSRITELADAAMDKLTKAALDGDPLWKPQEDHEKTYLTLMDIMKMVEVGEPHSSLLDLEIGNININTNTKPDSFKQQEQQHNHLQTEISRHVGYVRMEPARIVGFFMDLEQWSAAFSNIVSRAAILQVWSSMGSAENYHGTMQVMTAEFQIPTPLVPTRESYFVRYCKQLAPQTWGVVDVSLEHLFPYPSVGFRRKPSGCLIQSIPNGFSKVMWSEHVEVDNRFVHKIFEPLMNSGLAFGAKRWVSSLIRHCIWQATLLMLTTTPTPKGVLISQAGRYSVLKLAERMTRSFYSNVSTSKDSLWMKIPISGAEDIRVMTRNGKDDPGKPPCTSVIFSTSVHIPTTPRQVFHFLRHEKSRNKWDILSYGLCITELDYIINGDDPRNRVSVIQVNSAPRRVEIFYLQESFFDTTGSYIVYAPIDVFAMSAVFHGGNPDNVAILPSGFAVLPDKPNMNGEEYETDGSILTVALNIIDHSITERIPYESMDSMHKIMDETVASIKEAFTIQQF